MTLGLCFWILMLIWLVLGLYLNWPKTGADARAGLPTLGGGLLLFLLLVLLGWQTFGAPLHT